MAIKHNICLFDRKEHIPGDAEVPPLFTAVTTYQIDSDLLRGSEIHILEQVICLTLCDEFASSVFVFQIYENNSLDNVS